MISQYISQIINDVSTLLSKHNVYNISEYTQLLETQLNMCTNVELLKGGNASYNDSTRKLELSWIYGAHTYFRLYVKDQKLLWHIRYGDTHYNEKDNEGKAFFKLYQECVDKMESIYARLTSKLESKKELYYELKNTLEYYIKSLLRGTDDGTIKYLGINKSNFRARIDQEQFLDNYDLYSIDSYLSCFEISYKDKFCRLIDEKPLWHLAEQYIPIDQVTSTYETRDLSYKQISKKDFKERFLLLFRIYLGQIDSDLYKRNRYLQIIERSKCYLGIREETCLPEIGIIESLDNCDVYNLDDFMTCFTKKDGSYVYNLNKIHFREELPYKLLENKYYGTHPELIDELKPFKTVDDTRLGPSDYIQMLYHEFSERYDSSEHNIRCYLGDNYVYIPKPLMKHLKLKTAGTNYQIIWTRNQAKMLYEKAKGLQKKRDYLGAIAILQECLKLNSRYNKEVIDNLIVCYQKINDEENYLKTAQQAYDIAHHDVYRVIIESNKYRETINQTKTYDRNLGEEYEKELRKKPEYTFRDYDDPRYELNSPDTNIRKQHNIERKFEKLYRRIREIEDYISNAIKVGKEHEKLRSIEAAITIYEKLISERCYKTFPYDRLIIIYSKQKRNNDLKRILEQSITYFQSLEKRQWEYVQYLAEKYNATDLLKEQIDYNGKVGSWYPHIYLYQPYPIVEKWKQRLNKLK